VVRFSSPVHNNTKKSTTSRNTRLAGRLRFYKDVGVTSVEAPWVVEESKLMESVDSPISAGLDGSDSASGVHRPTALPESQLESLLTPRSPGSSHSPKSQEQQQWFGVTLDGRILKTPMGKTLAVPSEKLAYGIAAEWNAQGKHLKPTDMPFMTLACTALDQAAFHPQAYREQSLQFLPTDTVGSASDMGLVMSVNYSGAILPTHPFLFLTTRVLHRQTCFWADATEDRVLHRRQEQAWNDLHQFVQAELDHMPARALGAHEAMVMARVRGEAKPYAGLPHPPDLINKASDWTHSLDAWHLVSVASICSQAKSFLVAWAMVTPGSPLQDLNKATEASRVEEEFQISNWGLVEGGHDYDRLNCSIQLHSAQLFIKTIALDNQL
jgi:ATP synthase F1 complex assembly factor 2